MAQKKNQETELLSKEINSLSVRCKENQQKLNLAENELIELKDQLRANQNELDTRTQENDHLISLLEDNE